MKIPGRLSAACLDSERQGNWTTVVSCQFQIDWLAVRNSWLRKDTWPSANRTRLPPVCGELKVTSWLAKPVGTRLSGMLAALRFWMQLYHGVGPMG
jgi:hypothetical protein